jgi:hypothetical protein
MTVSSWFLAAKGWLSPVFVADYLLSILTTSDLLELVSIAAWL